MGASLSWFAVKNCDLDTTLSELGWEYDGGPDADVPRGVGVGVLPGGWSLLVFNRSLDQAFDPETTALSRHGPAVACAIEEHVMFQDARGYSEGVETWRITHDPNKGTSLYHLDISGEPPESLTSLREAAIAQQDTEGGDDANVDYIADVPLLVAKGLCGFKHDDAWPEGLEFTPIRRARNATGGGGFLSRLFGRR